MVSACEAPLDAEPKRLQAVRQSVRGDGAEHGQLRFLLPATLAFEARGVVVTAAGIPFIRIPLGFLNDLSYFVLLIALLAVRNKGANVVLLCSSWRATRSFRCSSSSGSACTAGCSEGSAPR